MLDEELVDDTITEVAEPVEVEDVEVPEAETEAVDSVVTFGDDEAQEEEADTKDPRLVKDLRKRTRDLNKENADLRKQIEAGKAEETPALGAEPTLDGCNYDADKYRDELRQYDAQKAQLDAKAKSVQDEQARQNEAYQGRLAEYNDARSGFDADDFDEAEANVNEALTETQRAILVHAFGKNAAPLISGLGRDDKRLKALASIKDPIAYAVAATRLEASMKTSQRKPRTAPETRVAGNNAGGNMSAKERKIEEARSKGDIKEVMRLKRAG